MSRHATYCSGPELKPSGPLTVQHARDILQQVQDDLNQGIPAASSDRYVLQFDHSCEGGIEVKHWPGKADSHGQDAYKGYRIHADRWWGFKPEDTPDQVLFDPATTRRRTPGEGARMWTYLKAFEGAPAWTWREVDAIGAAFERCGVRVYRSKCRLPGRPPQRCS